MPRKQASWPWTEVPGSLFYKQPSFPWSTGRICCLGLISLIKKPLTSKWNWNVVTLWNNLADVQPEHNFKQFPRPQSPTFIFLPGRSDTGVVSSRAWSFKLRVPLCTFLRLRTLSSGISSFSFHEFRSNLQSSTQILFVARSVHSHCLFCPCLTIYPRMSSHIHLLI